MGQIKSIPCDLSQEELTHFSTTTLFSKYEIRALWFHFRTISAKSDTITRDQFQAAMLFKDSALLDRIFRIFDRDDDNRISFAEYINCLSTISSKASQEDKLRFSFQIYDFDGDDRISIDDLTSALAATLREHNIVIARIDIDAIVASTMREAGPAEPDRIQFAEFKALASKRPHMLDHLNLNISKIIEEYSHQSGVTFETPRLG